MSDGRDLSVEPVPIDPPGDLPRVDRLTSDVTPLIVDGALTQDQVLDRLCAWAGVQRDRPGHGMLTSATQARLAAALLDAPEATVLELEPRNHVIDRLSRQYDIPTTPVKSELTKTDAVYLLVTTAQEADRGRCHLPSDSVPRPRDTTEDYRL